MKAVVLGAGIVGVSSAYELARDGWEVSVVERLDGVALETSFANGGQLSVDHGEPLAAPGVLKKALKWLGRHDAPLLWRLRLDPALWSWTLRFLANSSSPRYWRNAARILRITLYSRSRMAQTVAREKILFDHLDHGIISVFQNRADFDRAGQGVEAFKNLNSLRQILDRAGCLAIEPALADSVVPIVGGIHTPHDESGDCYAFTAALADRCRALGVDFRFNTTVTGLTQHGDEIRAVETSRGPITADLFVMALGSYSPQVLKSTGLAVPIYPAKGYSVTLPIADDAKAPHMSITSYDHKLVFSRIGGHLRIAGMLEFNGYDTHLDPRRAAVVTANALRLFPGAGVAEQAQPWTGLRPMTPDGAPVLGRARQANLILNTGHGMLGWTMAMGCARVTADLAANRSPEIDVRDLGWKRFTSSLSIHG